jgi:K+ transporter
MTVLLYFVSFASLAALVASVIAGTFWLLARLIRTLVTPRAERKRRSEASAGFHPHHLKRAGQ